MRLVFLMPFNVLLFSLLLSTWFPNTFFFVCLPQTPAEQQVADKMAAKSNTAVYKLRQKVAKVDPVLEDEFMSGRVLGKCPAAF